MELDLMATAAPLRDVQRYAIEAERGGADGMVFTESGRTAYLSAAAAGLAAPKLSLATGVTVAFPRSPMITAKVAWELADLTHGKFRLGIGTQVRAHVERRYSALFEPPGPRLRDYVQALRAIFRSFQTGEPLEYRGPFYEHTLLPRAWSPGPIDHAEVPIDIAAVNPWMLRMAGEVADGIHIHPMHSVGYLDEIVRPSVEEGAAKAGRDGSTVKLIVPVLAVVGDTEEERAPLRDQVKYQLGFYGSTRNYAFQWDRVGLPGMQQTLNEKLKAGDFAGIDALMTPEVLSHFSVEATWDELPSVLLDKYRGRADRVVIYLAESMWRHDPSTVERWADIASALHAA